MLACAAAMCGCGRGKMEPDLRSLLVCSNACTDIIAYAEMYSKVHSAYPTEIPANILNSSKKQSGLSVRYQTYGHGTNGVFHLTVGDYSRDSFEFDYDSNGRSWVIDN